MRFLRKRKQSELDELIMETIGKMKGIDQETDEYTNLLDNLERLIRLKGEEPKRRVSPDTLAIVIGNIVGVLVIVGFEQGHVLASKAVGLIIRPKDGRTMN